ncbi:uncharacterized protein LOC132162354 [Corylus avellana]|uniref:uncharacterized protein LOC132162354 n=1 Tax=Corylus avellana TaxID=13451 RepID=UPI00286D3DD2|nr:uncharacterized protein LOC132162354 [Corylus avellana]
MDRSLVHKMFLIESDSDEELEKIAKLAMEEEISSNGRSKQHRKFIWRDRLQAHKDILSDYFAKEPLYPHKYFWRRFRMSHPLFQRIQCAVESHDTYFVQNRDGSRRLGCSSLQKITTAIRMLAYGVTTDFVDQYLKIGETTIIESLKRFVKAVISVLF